MAKAAWWLGVLWHIGATQFQDRVVGLVVWWAGTSSTSFFIDVGVRGCLTALYRGPGGERYGLSGGQAAFLVGARPSGLACRWLQVSVAELFVMLFMFIGTIAYITAASTATSSSAVEDVRNGIGTPVCGIGMVVVVYFDIGATQFHSEVLLFLSGLDFFFVVKEAEAGFVVERAIVFVWLSL